MILLYLLAYCLVGAFSAGVVFALRNENIDPTGAVIMTAFAPFTLLYVVCYLALMGGIKIVDRISK